MTEEAGIARLTARVAELDREQQHSLEVVAESYQRAEKAESEATALRSQVAALREALEPFARFIESEPPLPAETKTGGWCGGRQLTVADLRRARSALAGAPAPSPWRPISEARRDGTPVLISAASVVGEARFCDPDGWYWAGNDPSDAWGCAVFPDYWMPLPPAPAADGEGG